MEVKKLIDSKSYNLLDPDGRYFNLSNNRLLVVSYKYFQTTLTIYSQDCLNKILAQKKVDSQFLCVYADRFVLLFDDRDKYWWPSDYPTVFKCFLDNLQCGKAKDFCIGELFDVYADEIAFLDGNTFFSLQPSADNNLYLLIGEEQENSMIASARYEIQGAMNYKVDNIMNLGSNRFCVNLRSREKGATDHLLLIMDITRHPETNKYGLTYQKLIIALPKRENRVNPFLCEPHLLPDKTVLTHYLNTDYAAVWNREGEKIKGWFWGDILQKYPMKGQSIIGICPTIVPYLLIVKTHKGWYLFDIQALSLALIPVEATQNLHSHPNGQILGQLQQTNCVKTQAFALEDILNYKRLSSITLRQKITLLLYLSLHHPYPYNPPVEIWRLICQYLVAVDNPYALTPVKDTSLDVDQSSFCVMM